MLWQPLMVAAVVAVASAARQDRWVWSRDTNNKTASIPGYVKPTARPFHSPTTTPQPPITTFRPHFPRTLARGAGAASARHFPRVSANPFFLGPFAPPFPFLPVRPPVQYPDGTTKSRVPQDTSYDEGSGGASLTAGDKYTTLDRLQSERGPPPSLPRPREHQLGGLHPDEVFYADDDLLIIKGGGFHSDRFEEPAQTLDEDDDKYGEGAESNVSPVRTPLPDPHHEYNGNVPSFLPPPPQPAQRAPYALYVGDGTRRHYMLVPYVFPAAPSVAPVTNALDYGTDPGLTYVYPGPVRPWEPSLRPGGPVLPGHSLAGDTRVNFLHPRPHINPEAEVFRPLRHFSRPPRRRPGL